MNERERMAEEATTNESRLDALEDRLRAMYAALYPPTFPPVKPSGNLQRRVAAITTRQPIRRARPSLPAWVAGRWRSVPAGWKLASAGALAGVVLLTILGLTIGRPENHRSPKQEMPFIVKGGQPERPMAAPRSIPPLPPNDPERRIVDRDRVPPRTRGHVLPRFPVLANDATRRSIGSNQSARPDLLPHVPVIDGLVSMNREPEAAVRQWVRVPQDDWNQIEARVRRDVRVRDDFVQIPFPRIADATGTQIAAAVATYQREGRVRDPRLSREVTCAFKATALSDLCDRLRTDTGIQLTAGSSIADEKVTLFCKELPLRDVMRQLSRPFGYTWLRSGKENDYRYELVQDLRSQLLEEELRNRDRNAALLALDAELGRFWQYLDLSPDEALARARNATGEEKKRLERYASWAWGPIQIYQRLTPADLTALRAGRRIHFSGQPREGERALPADLERGVLQSMRDRRLVKTENGFRPAGEADALNSVSPAQVPEARGRISIEIDQDDLGKMVYDVSSGITGIYPNGGSWTDGGYLAVGESPSVRSPENAMANRALARDPALASRITLTARPAYRPAPDAQPSDGDPPPARGYTSALPAQPMVTTAEVLEAIHQATGLPIVADYYTHLYPASSLSVPNVRVFDALNHLCDTMRLRWRKDGAWLQLRSASYFHDRLKEVPNRLLRRWAASRKQHGVLTLDDICEIVGLSGAQLDAEEMAEGARALYGLMEWELFPRRGGLRQYLKHLAEFTPAQRQQMQTPPGLFFSQMTLAQQQGFVTLALGPDGNGPARLEHLAGATMRVDYAVPGTYEWSPLPEEWRLRPSAASPFTAEALLPRVRERTREAALLAARRIDPQVSAAQIRPTEPALTILYLPGPGSPLSAGGICVARASDDRRMVVRAP